MFPVKSSPGRVYTALVVLIFLSATLPSWGQRKPAIQVQLQQLQRNRVKVAGGDPFADNGLALPQPPRELRRALQAAESAVEEEEFSEAVESLNMILDAKDSEDYFLPGKGGSALSLKRRAMDLLGAMPNKGREIYELQVRSEARQLLDEAIEAFDVDKITEVSRRFFHSSVGYEATMLLARYELDQGRSLAAAMHLVRLKNAPASQAQFANEVPLLLALCWYMAGHEDTAASTLKENLASLAGRPIKIGGIEQRMPDTLENPKEWLKSAVGAGIALRLAKGDNWKLFRGGPDRNASVPGGMPIGKMEWWLTIAAADPADATKIMEWHTDNLDNHVPLIPSMQPLAVGDYLLMRTSRMMFGVDIESGRRIWPYPDETLESSSKGQNNKPTTANPYQYQSRSTSDPLRSRIWQDAPFAQLSSDGKRVFLLRDLDTNMSPYANAQIFIQARNRQPVERHNSLVALELESEGKLLWKAGGPDSGDRQLANAYFLGTPLPLDDHLFVIAEIKDELKLLSIDAKSGELEWSQQLAQVESSVYSMGSLRRLAGATPSFSEGILICPTSNGAVVAVELSSRSLLWGTKYTLSSGSPGFNNGNPFGGRQVAIKMPVAGNHWVDATAVISNGHVVLTPPEADRLMCLDLLSGNPAWPPVAREDMLFVGAIHEGNILMIGSKKLRGIQLSDGKPAWKNIVFEEGEYPSGRGFMNDGHYYLPTSRSEILKINIADGSIVERQATERPLGNIICHTDYLISQSPEGVYAYPLRERRRGIIARQLAETPNDPDVLENYANLLAADGKPQEAINTMERAIEFQSDADRKTEMQSLLARIIINALHDDFAGFKDYLPKARELSKSPDARLDLAEIVVNGVGKSDPVAGFSAQLDLIDSTIDKRIAELQKSGTAQRRLRAGEPNYRRNRLLDAALKINSLLDVASDDNQSVMIRQLVNRVSERNLPIDKLDAWCTVGNAVDLASNDATLSATMRTINSELADHWLDEDNRVFAELALIRLRNNADEGSPNASLKLAKLYESMGKYEAAAREFERMGSKWSKNKFSDGSSGSELAAAFRKRTKATMPTPPNWPEGKIVATVEEDTIRTTARQWYQIKLLSASEEWPEGMTLALDYRNSSVVVIDSKGIPLVSIPTNTRYTPSYRGCHARIYGHVAIVSTGISIVALDLLSDYSDDENRLLWRYDTYKQTNGGRSRPSIRTNASNVVFEEQQNTYTDTVSQLPMGQLGPISHNGVTFMAGGKMHCVDLRTGKPKWTRSGFKRNIIFGDEQVAYSSNPRTGKTEAFKILDGSKVGGEYRMPLGKSHWRPWGRYILYYAGSYQTGNDLQLRLFDPIAQSDVWKLDLDAKFKAHFFAQNEFAIIQRNGTFGIYDAATGKPKFETEVEVDPTLSPPRVFKGRDHYILATNHDDQPYFMKLQRAKIYLRMPQQGYPLPNAYGLNGHVYAFDFQGKAIWKNPIKVNQFSLLAPFPVDGPVLAFLREVTRRKPAAQNGRNTSEIVTEIVVVDRRTGQKVWETTRTNQRPQFSYLETKAAADQIVLTIPGIQRTTFTVTNDSADDVEDKPLVLARIPLPDTPKGNGKPK